MLIAHASSTCDVCLESYTENCSYHSIPCGHVFCLPCLVSTNPARCPLCRHEFSPYSMRKLHLTLPTARDIAARNLEMKLVQSSPDMALAESLNLFQEVQEWLEGEAQEEFLVLRAFAAVLCGFHETKDKLIQNQARSEQNEAELKRLLEEARTVSLPKPDIDYKNKYKTAKAELAVLRAECAELRAEADKQQQSYQAHYAHIQAQAQLKVQTQTEPQALSRRISNPLPTPPRPVEIPFLKYIEARPSSRYLAGSKGKGKESSALPINGIDPMSSAFVPTLSASIPSRHHDNVDGRQEVTTLVFKPPKRVPIWDSPATSYTPIDDQAQTPPGGSSNLVSDAGATIGIDSVSGSAVVNGVPTLEMGHSEIHQRSHRTAVAQPLSHVSTAGWAEPSLAHQNSTQGQSVQASRKTSRREGSRHHQESYQVPASTSQPVVDTEIGAPALLSPVLDPPPTPKFMKTMRRPAWQGGVDTAFRRVSSPVMGAGNSGPPTHYVPRETAQHSEGEDFEGITRRTTFVRSYTVHPLDTRHTEDHRRGRDHQRPSTPLQGSHLPESHSDPEPGLTARSTLLSPSPQKIGKETTRYSGRGHHALGHGHSQSLMANWILHPTLYPSSIHSRSHDDLLAYPARPFSSESRAPSSRIAPEELPSSAF